MNVPVSCIRGALRREYGKRADVTVEPGPTGYKVLIEWRGQGGRAEYDVKNGSSILTLILLGLPIQHPAKTPDPE